MTRQLATLVRSGLPLEESLLAVSEQSERPRVQSIMIGVRSKVMEGHALADGFADFPRVFPEIFRATVAAGEQSGRLDVVLERLADYTENRQQIGSKVTGAIVYPVALTFFAVSIVTFLLGYVVPMVVEVFSSVKAELPLATRILIGVSNYVRSFGLWTAIALGGRRHVRLLPPAAARPEAPLSPVPAARAADRAVWCVDRTPRALRGRSAS